MRPGEFAVALKDSIALFVELELMMVLRTSHSLAVPERFRRQARDRDYTELYRVGLEDRAYNFALTDFAYMQFAYVSLRNGYGVRYAYYPNPYAGSTYGRFLREYEESLGDSDGYEEFVQYLQEQRPHHPAPPIRYDIAFQDYVELAHPSAHFHFGMHSENRWPSSVELTPLAFSLLIAKMFYCDEWAAAGDGRTGRDMHPLDRRFIAAKAACRAVDAGYFSANERAQLHFG